MESNVEKIRKQPNICQCPVCGHSHIIDLKEVAIYQGMVRALNRVFKWCLEKRKHEFRMSEVRDLIGKIEYPRFGNWPLFGGLVYRPEPGGKIRGYYGINMERTAAFFAGKYRIPKRIWKNPITHEVTHEERDMVSLSQIPRLIDLLDTEGEYLVDYAQNKLL